MAAVARFLVGNKVAQLQSELGDPNEDPEGYISKRNTAVTVYAAASGFLPINPVLWPMQISIFIVLFLIFLFLVDFSVGPSALIAYAGQGIVTTLVVRAASIWLLENVAGLGE